MKHKLKISVSKQPKENAVVATKKISIREKLLAKLFGPVHKLTILIPGDTVDEVCIIPIEKVKGDQYAR